MHLVIKMLRTFSSHYFFIRSLGSEFIVNYGLNLGFIQLGHKMAQWMRQQLEAVSFIGHLSEEIHFLPEP